MGPILNKAETDPYRGELCEAISDLANSVDVAVINIKLRAKCDATIADAEKVENAAASLRAALTAPTATSEQTETPLVPDVRGDKGAQTSDCLEGLSGLETMDTIRAACDWLTESQTSGMAPKPQAHNESAIAMRIVELQDRMREQDKL